MKPRPGHVEATARGAAVALASPRIVRAAVIAAGIATALVLSACTGGSDAVDPQVATKYSYQQATKKGALFEVSKRKLAGPVAGEVLAGGKYQLSSDLGHVVVLNFFATWCGPCQTETPQFDALYRERESSGVRFVGLDVKDTSQNASRSWLAAKQITYPVVWDQPGKTALELGKVPIAGLPGTVLIDKQGRVAAVYVGITLPADLTPALNTLSAET